MSLDYCTGGVSMQGNVAQSFIANATKKIGGGIFSKSYDWLALTLQVAINTAATAASQTVVWQMAASDNTFTSPTVLATVTITSSHTAGTTLITRVDPSVAKIPAGRLTRLVHTAGATDATLDYDYIVSGTAVHE